MMELILTRIFSVKLYYHYAFMVISLALLGSGASGIYVYLFPGFFRKERLTWQLFLFSLLFAASIPLVVWLVVELDFELVFNARAIVRVFLFYSLPAIPFFWAGICISLAMSHLASQVNRLYFFDLIGAALGCLLVIPLLDHLGGPNALLAVSIIAGVASWLLSGTGIPRGWRLLPAVLLVSTCGMLIYSASQPVLTIKHVKGRNEGPLLFSKWNSFSRITVVQVANNPKNTWIIMDGDAGTLLPRFNGDFGEWQYLRKTVSALAYHLKKDAETLIIGPGGGIDVLTALVFGNTRITGVEINPIIVNNVMRGQFSDFTGRLYFRPEVQILVDEGRSFIRKAPQQYDIIQATLVDTWAATSAGAFALTENNLYTVEAFKDYLSKLKPDGILSITRWNLEPPQQDLRLVAITRAAMQELRIPNPERSMMVVRRSRGSEAVECNFLFKKSGFSENEIHHAEEVSRTCNFDILYTPHTIKDSPFARLITTSAPHSFYASYPYNVTPTYDNSPFFFYTIRLKQLWSSLFLSWESKKTNVGMLVLFLVLGVALFLVLLFIFIPLYSLRREVIRESPGHRLTELSYFVCLGLGFILVEITLIQKFMLLLGPPVYALSVVIFSILLFSGLGSFFSGRLSKFNLDQSLKNVCLLISGLLLLYLFSLPFLLYSCVGLRTLHKAIFVMGSLFPVSFLMGMPMPLGIHWLRNRSPEMIPWAWGVNGSASVLGSIMAILIAINLGFNQALIAAASLYLVAACIVKVSRKISD
jgi:predicted membrane-bound spermidine synthase